MVKINPDWWKTLFDEIYLITDGRSVCDDNGRRCDLNVTGFNNISNNPIEFQFCTKKEEV